MLLEILEFHSFKIGITYEKIIQENKKKTFLHSLSLIITSPMILLNLINSSTSNLKPQ